ncbi:hypothetical protein BGW37DRAFT_548946 [Umbelopsis sp. PMI_123]|nr:hypothetical protein BGW37DRAFT_548946 [Umbelopsis sp. PMI_123]
MDIHIKECSIRSAIFPVDFDVWMDSQQAPRFYLPGTNIFVPDQCFVQAASSDYVFLRPGARVSFIELLARIQSLLDDISATSETNGLVPLFATKEEEKKIQSPSTKAKECIHTLPYGNAAKTERVLSSLSNLEISIIVDDDDVEHFLPPNETLAYRESKRKSLESASKLNRTESNASSDIGSPSLRPQGRKRQVLGEIPVHMWPEYAEYFVNGSVTPNARTFELHYTEESWEEAVEVFRHSQATESLPSVFDFFSEDVRSRGSGQRHSIAPRGHRWFVNAIPITLASGGCAL